MVFDIANDEPYQGTYIYWANMYTSIAYLLAEPLLQLSLFNQYNNWNIEAILASLMTWSLSIISSLLLLATIEVQSWVMNFEIYIRGFTMILFLSNLAQVMINFYFWFDSIDWLNPVRSDAQL